MNTNTFKSLILNAAVLLAATLLLSCCRNSSPISQYGWSDEVRTALNDFIGIYGNPEQPEYVVFDFDNTCCIYDVSEQLVVYQLETMSFALGPEQFYDAVRVGLEGCRPLTEERTERAALLYASLYDRYGPFTYEGLPDGMLEALHNDSEWQQFADLMGGTYHLLAREHAIENPYMWAMGWFAGMSSSELYELFVRSDRYYAAVPTRERSWGQFSWTDGLRVTDNIRELWKALDQSGIDVWVCSASSIEAVMASIDEYGLHQYCTGAIGMTLSKDENGLFDGGYDYQTGYARLAGADGSWTECDIATGVQTKGPGKVTAIERCLRPRYEGRGPLAAFGDSSGDFNFMTEFASLKLAVLFNRAELDVTDGGALLAETALYQRDVLGYDLSSANAAGDIYYVLQGRDVNGLRSLYPSDSTVLLGMGSPRLFRSMHSSVILDSFVRDSLSVKQILEKYCIRTPASESAFGCAYGWLGAYDGYRCR